MLIRLTAVHVHNGTEYPVATILDLPTEIRDWLATANKAINVTNRGEWTNVLVPAANDLVSYGTYWFYANPANVPPAAAVPGVHAGWVRATYGAVPVINTNVIAELNVTILRVKNTTGGFVQVQPVTEVEGSTLDLADPVTIA